MVGLGFSEAAAFAQQRNYKNTGLGWGSGGSKGGDVELSNRELAKMHAKKERPNHVPAAWLRSTPFSVDPPLQKQGAMMFKQLSWLMTRRIKKNNKILLGCASCSKMDSGCAFGKFRACRKLGNILRHQTSKIHQANVKLAIEGSGGAVEVEPREETAPLAADYVKLWDDISKGATSYQGLSGVGKRKKLYKMRWTLKEAMKNIERRFLKTADCIAIARDESNGNLALRYKATRQKDLETRRGLMGVSRGHSMGSTGITNATKKLFKRCMTEGSGLIYGKRQSMDTPAPTFHSDGYKKMKLTTEALAVDSASDEVRSGIQMAGGIDREREIAFTPNLKALLRDKLHGARRCWDCKMASGGKGALLNNPIYFLN